MTASAASRPSPNELKSEILDQAKTILQIGGYDLCEIRAMRTGLGWHLRCVQGQVINLYRTGRLVVGGSNARAIENLFDAAPPPPKQAPVEPHVVTCVLEVAEEAIAEAVLHGSPAKAA